MYTTGVPEHIQEKVAEILGNASKPEEPAAKKLKTDTIPTAGPPGKAPGDRDIAAADGPPPKASRRSGPQGGRGRGGRQRG